MQVKHSSLLISAQPTELSMNVMDVVNGVTASFEIPSAGSRDVPLPAIGIFEFTCRGSADVPKKAWYFVNSSDMSESVEEIPKTDLESTNGSVVQYSKSSNSWVLRLVNASDMYGVYECTSDFDMISVNIIESKNCDFSTLNSCLVCIREYILVHLPM